jgi:segregation and condensation protein B
MSAVNQDARDETAAAEAAEEEPMGDAQKPSAAGDAGLRSEPGDAAEDDVEVPVLTDPAEAARLLLPVLLAAREGLSLVRLAEVMNCTQKNLIQAMAQLQQDLGPIPLEVRLEGDRMRVLTGEEVHPYLQRLRGVKKKERLSPAALETLAVIAYRQPVIRAEIEAIRGVKAGPVLRTLLEHKLIRVVGRADVPGRPLQYGTGDHFLERFGLESLKDLPSIREFKNLG